MYSVICLSSTMISTSQISLWLFFLLISLSALNSGQQLEQMDYKNMRPVDKINKDSGFFWHISDIHWDRQYSVYGDPKNMCHETPPHRNAPKNAGILGNFNCDAPLALVNSSIQAIYDIKPNPDFIVWTGDNSPHVYNPTPDWTEIFGALKKISRLLTKNFPNVPILPVIGNHDTNPPDKLDPNSTIYDKYLVSGGWDILLSEGSARETFGMGGFYNMSVKEGLQVVGLNTILWWQRNDHVANLSDPAGQFAWLEQVLEDATQSGSKVYLIGHVPPGFYARTSPEKETVVYYPKFNKRYIDLVNKYKDVIMGQLFGHQHYDSFMLFQDENGETVNSILLGPSITPWHDTYKESNLSVPVNPAVRLVRYNKLNGQLMDYDQHFLNLTKANEAALEEKSNAQETDANVTWELLYTFTKEYNLPDLSAKTLKRHYENIKNDRSVYEKYIYFTTSGKNVGPCNGFCRTSHLCSMEYVSEEEYYKCMNATFDDTVKEHLDATVAMPENKPVPTKVKYYTTDNSENNTAHYSSIVIGCIASLLVLIAIVMTAWWRHKRSTYVVRYMAFA